MCPASGFNLTKVTSNAKEVLMPIPEVKRCNELKDQDLVSGVIPLRGSTWNKLEYSQE